MVMGRMITKTIYGELKGNPINELKNIEYPIKKTFWNTYWLLMIFYFIAGCSFVLAIWSLLN